MPTILSNSEFQKNPGKLSQIVFEKGAILTTHGTPKMVVMPYFEESDELLEEYFEHFELWKNRKKLQKEMADSKQSGESDFSL